MAVHASPASGPVPDGGEALTPRDLPIRHLSINFRGDPTRVVLVPFGASQRQLTEVFDLVAGMGEAEVEGTWTGSLPISAAAMHESRNRSMGTMERPPGRPAGTMPPHPRGGG